MGFPTGYSQKMLPYFLTLLRLLGLSNILESSINWPEPEPESKPASASIIQEMLPVMKFSDLECATKPEQCAVCLNEFRSHEEIRVLINCNHVFHRACVDSWMNHDQISCPLCRTHIVPNELLEVFHEKVEAAAAISGVPDFGGEFSVINSFFLECPLR